MDPIQLKLALRDLWVDHIVYTRNYIRDLLRNYEGKYLYDAKLWLAYFLK